MSLSLGSSNQRVRMRTAAGLDSGDLLGILDVRDIEDAHAAETIFLSCGRVAFFFVAWGRWRFRWKSLRAAIEAAVGHFHGHEQKVFVHRDIALAAGADHRGQQRCLGGIGDVINIHAVKISLEQVIALERQV